MKPKLSPIEGARIVLAYIADSLPWVDVPARPVDADVASQVIADLGVAIGKCDDPIKRAEYTSQLRDALAGGDRVERAAVLYAGEVEAIRVALSRLVAMVDACPNCNCSKGSSPQSARATASLSGETTSARRKTPAGGLSDSGSPDRPTSSQSSAGISSGSRSRPRTGGFDAHKEHGATLASPLAGRMSSRSASTTRPAQSTPRSGGKANNWAWASGKGTT